VVLIGGGVDVEVVDRLEGDGVTEEVDAGSSNKKKNNNECNLKCAKGYGIYV
jgi:hypothetical protein